MSLEAFGDDGLLPEELTADDLYAHGWSSDPDAKSWWRGWDPESKFSLSEACDIEEARWEDLD